MCVHSIGYSLHISNAQCITGHRYHICVQCSAVSIKWNSRSGVDGMKDKCIYGKQTFEEESPES